ncbi:MAG: M64 family metallopeptidase [Bacteroidales bacterium]
MAIGRKLRYLITPLLLLVIACGKELPPVEESIELPTVETTLVTDIAGSSAKAGGIILDNGGGFITSKGICWSSSPNPSLVNSITNEGSGNANFIGTLTQLDQEGVTYYVRAYATNRKGTAYGNEVKFNTRFHLEGGYSIYMEHSKGEYPNEIIILGDGYLESDFQYGNKFDQDATTAVEAFFSIEPYLSYREYFKVYKVAAYSQERGASILDDNITKQTAFSTTFTAGTHLTTNTSKVFQYASTIPAMSAKLPNTLIILMVNQDKYGGYCYSQIDGVWDTRVIAICPVSSSNKIGANFTHFRNLVMHEAGGHGFGRLADEYVSAGGSGKEITQSYRDRYLNGLPYGMRPNIDLTGDPNRVKWKHFLGVPGYEAVGTYEGAFVHSYGVWRPEESSCMINNIAYFNAPSREHIVKRIVRTAAGVRVNDYLDGIVTPIPGDPFNFEDFVAKDIVRNPFQ